MPSGNAGPDAGPLPRPSDHPGRDRVRRCGPSRVRGRHSSRDPGRLASHCSHGRLAGRHFRDPASHCFRGRSPVRLRRGATWQKPDPANRIRARTGPSAAPQAEPVLRRLRCSGTSCHVPPSFFCSGRSLSAVLGAPTSLPFILTDHIRHHRVYYSPRERGVYGYRLTALPFDRKFGFGHWDSRILQDTVWSFLVPGSESAVSGLAPC